MFKRFKIYFSRIHIFAELFFVLKVQKKKKKEKNGLHMTTQAQEEKIINQKRRLTLDINA